VDRQRRRRRGESGRGNKIEIGSGKIYGFIYLFWVRIQWLILLGVG